MGKLVLKYRHKLLCGDSTDEADVDKLMCGEKADMVFTDPPYGISIVNPKVSGKSFGNNIGNIRANLAKVGEYKPIVGDDDTETAKKAFDIVSNYESIIFWGANYYSEHLPASKAWLVWDKDTTGSLGDGELAWTNKDKALRIFKHRWSGMIKDSEHGQARVHPTQKPIALAEWCFENYGDPKSVLDLFLGSGSTLIACEKTNRRCFGSEIDPHYCSVIIKRFEDYANEKAVRLDDASRKAN